MRKEYEWDFSVRRQRKQAFNECFHCVTFVNTVKIETKMTGIHVVVVRTVSYHITFTKLRTKVSISFMS